MLVPTTVLLAGAGLAAAATIPVSIGKNDMTFDPAIIHAAVGDVIEFRYWPWNHSVVAGDFSSACRPASSGGFFSGFFPTQAGTVNVTLPHFLPFPSPPTTNPTTHTHSPKYSASPSTTPTRSRSTAPKTRASAAATAWSASSTRPRRRRSSRTPRWRAASETPPRLRAGRLAASSRSPRTRARAPAAARAVAAPPRVGGQAPRPPRQGPRAREMRRQGLRCRLRGWWLWVWALSLCNFTRRRLEGGAVWSHGFVRRGKRGGVSG